MTAPRIGPWDSCVHNPSILCEEKDKCEKCGWNPDYAIIRKEAIRKKRKGEKN